MLTSSAFHQAFAYGLPGALDPVGDFDPAGFTERATLEEMKMYREAHQGYAEVLGKKHYTTLGMMLRLGNVLYEQDKLWEATGILREALKGCRESIGAKGARTRAVSQSLAKVLNTRGRAAEAASILRECGEGAQ